MTHRPGRGWPILKPRPRTAELPHVEWVRTLPWSRLTLPVTGLREKARVAFLGLNVVNAAATIVAMAFATSDAMLLTSPVLAVCALVVAHWRTARRGRTGVLDEATVAVAMLAGSLALPDVTMTVSLVFSAIMFRSLYGSHRQAAARTAGYVAVYAAALLLADGTDRLDTTVRSALLLPLPALLMSALTMRILFVAVQQRDAAAARQAILAQTATRLLGVTDMPTLAATGWQAQQEVLDGHPAEAFVLDECPDGFVVASGTVGGPGRRVDATDVAVALCSPDREPVTLREPGPTLLALSPRARWWYLVPTAVDDLVTRVLVLACGDRLPADAVGASQVLMRQTALAVNALAHRAELHRQASQDAVTGLANRTEFMRRLTGDAAAPGTGATAVLFIDLDGFKAVNDRHGHAAGDELLTIVAGRLAASVRPDDTVARLGGDEFAVLVPDVASEREATALADRLEATLREPALLDGGAIVHVGASIGVHVAARPYVADQLLQLADTAMYRVKADHHARGTPVAHS